MIAVISRWMQLLALICASMDISLALQERTFTIDYDKNTFMKDGKPFRYISGSIHYMRVPNQYWEDRLKKMAACGLNAIQTVVPWNAHEPTPNNYTFSGQQDISSFLTIAQKYNLSVILRPGPFIGAGWEFGGFPAWLLEDSDIKLRTMNHDYIQAVDRWLTKLYTEIRPLLYKNGGPIITVQIENEYGSYSACDHGYLHHLKNKTVAMLGEEVVFFTTDRASLQALQCGSIPGVYATVGFGTTDNPETFFAIQRQKQSKGPLVNSEFYTGSIDHWGQNHTTIPTSPLVECLDQMLALDANVNMYMFEGGTNFQYWNGATSPFSPIPTSYDYDAPLTEAGDITTKYMALRQVIAKYSPLPKMAIPPSTPKFAYGKVNMTYIIGVPIYAIGLKPVMSDYPLTMEQLKHYNGFVLYQHQLTVNVNNAPLDLSGVRDRAYVSIRSLITPTPIGVVDRSSDTNNISITAYQGDYIHILVENQGRISCGDDINNNTKGLISNVTLEGRVLRHWRNIPIDLFEVLPENARRTRAEMYKQPPASEDGHVQRDVEWLRNQLLQFHPQEPTLSTSDCVPTFFMGKLTINGDPMDTYLDMSQWSKGQLYINGHNIGRYWPHEGPQVRLFVPKYALHNGDNQIVLLELERTPCSEPDKCIVQFMDQPLIDGPVSLDSQQSPAEL